MSIRKPVSAVCLLTVVMVMAVLGQPVVASVSKGKATPRQESAAAKMEKRWGVRIVGLRRTANNYMLDFRFKVVDPKKVGEIMDRKVRPEMRVEGKDIKVNVPVTAKLGSLRQTTKFAQANRNYFMLFANPGHRIKKGDMVTIKIGKFMAKHIVVQ